MATRRRVLQASGALLLSLLTESTALAQEPYPGGREVHVIVAFAPGSAPDIAARYFSENMRPFLGGTIVVENKVGASGNIAIVYVAKAKPDGYTILMPAIAIAAGLSLFKNPGYDASEFAVLGSICRFPFTVSVAANSPHKTLQSLITAVRAKGANASYGTTAPSGQISGAMMKNILKLEAVEVPYRTSPDSLNDLNGGALDYAMYPPDFALLRHREGKLRVLAVTSKDRMTTIAPDIPTMDESGVPGVDVTGWFGAVVPAAVPQPIKDKISSAFLKMAEKPETKKWLTELGVEPWVVGPAEAQAQMIKDIKNWAEWVKLANLEPKG
jgi:tripartite-type tricarboxylate transporter receptor subunit TctC